MKCICGYEQKEPFEHYRFQIPTINPVFFKCTTTSNFLFAQNAGR